jgi:TonB family protein
MTVAVVILMLASVAVPARSAPQERTAPSNQLAAAVPPVPVAKMPVPAPPPSTARADSPKKQAAATQVQRGNLTGTVQDAMGGVLPGVTVVLTPVTGGGRGRAAATPQRQVITNASGRFVFDDLDPLQYDLTATLSGFRRHRSRLTVRPDTREYATVQLDIGSVSEEVTVSSGTKTLTPADPRGTGPGPAAEYFDLAKLYYQQGRLAQAEEATSVALQIIRSQTQATKVSTEPGARPNPIRVGGEIREPRKIRDVKPIYPAEAVAAGTEGVVIIEATIARDGTVTNARVLRSASGLDEAALTAVRQWQFTPTRLNGVPVEVLMTVSVRFVR